MNKQVDKSTLSARSILIYVFLALIFLGIFILILSRAMRATLSHDEYLFLASGQMLANKSFLPYIDFPYLHLPYLAGVFGILFKLTDYNLLAARAFSALCGALSALALFYIAVKTEYKSNSYFKYFMGWMIVALLVTNTLFIKTHDKAWNHPLPALLSILAFISYMYGSKKVNQIFYYILCGALVGLSAGMRITYIILVLPFSLAVFVYPFGKARVDRFRHILFFGGGVFISLLPLVFFILAAPKQFLYGTYIIFKLNTVYRQLLRLPETAITLSDKLKYFIKNVYLDPLNFVIFSIAALFSIWALYKLIKTRDHNSFFLLLAVLISALLLLTGFGTTPSFIQYFFAPLPFLLITIIYGFAGMKRFQWLLYSVIVVVLVISTYTSGNFQRRLEDIRAIAYPEDWIPVQVHRFTQVLRRIVPEGKVLTISPVYPLEAALDIYPVLAPGPFSWRNSHLLSAEKRAEYGVISYLDLEDMLVEDPPQAVLTGFEANYEGFNSLDDGGLEKPLIDYAKKNGYKPIRIPAGFTGVEVTLWVR